MKIKVHTRKNDGQIILYYISKDVEKLKAVLKRYNIKVSLCYEDDDSLLFWKHELEDIEKQWKLARKQERQR